MNLYCYKLKDINNHIMDVYHIVAKNSNEAQFRLEATIRQCAVHGISDKYNSFSFSKVDNIDGFRVRLDSDDATA